jgi:2-enoate reductase
VLNDKLFADGNIGRCSLKNRIIMAPMGNINMADPIGRPLPKMIDYFAQRAKGGTGLLITGLIPVSYGIDPTVSEDNDTTYFPRIDGSSRTRLAGWRDLAATVHAYDAKIFIQLTAGLGRVGSPEPFLKGKLLKSASLNKNFYVPQLPHFPMTDRGIKKIVKSFGQCAVNAKVAGFDGIHLHGHEGYLMDQLTSKPWNRRKLGRYAKLFQFGIDVVREIKKRCGENYPVIYRLDLTQSLLEAYGETVFNKQFKGRQRNIDEGLEFCKQLAAAGVDAFDVDKGCYDNWFYPHPPAYFDDMPYVEEMAGRLKEYFEKEKITSKVIAVGKMGKPEVARSVLEKGLADFVMLGRPLLADPYWPQKVLEGREREIIHCIGDQEACIHSFINGGHPCCTVNPYTGFEDTKNTAPAAKSKRVAVVGGGPGGMEAAKTAFQRGHEVTLFESSPQLGGQLYLSAQLPIKHDLKRYIENQQYIMSLLEEQGLNVKPDHTATAQELEGFDVVIFATGVSECIPLIDGVGKLPHTTVRQFLKDEMKLPDGTKKITVVGGGVTGCEVAFTLANTGLEVTVVEMLPELMNDAVHANRSMMLWLMMGRGSVSDKPEDRLKIPVKAYTASKLTAIKEDGVTITANTRRWDAYTPWRTLIPESMENPFAKKLKPDETEEIFVNSDFVLFASGVTSENTLYRELKESGKSTEIYLIGDSRQPASAWDAITGGNEIARHI